MSIGKKKFQWNCHFIIKILYSINFILLFFLNLDTFYYAIRSENIDFVRYFIENHYDNQKVNLNSKSILLSALNGNTDIFNLIISLPEININDMNFIHEAINKNYTEIAISAISHPTLNINTKSI